MRKPELPAEISQKAAIGPTQGWVETQPALQQWYASHLGQSILELLLARLDHILPGVFGYQGLQLGTIEAGRSFLELSGIHRPLLLESPASSVTIPRESATGEDTSGSELPDAASQRDALRSSASHVPYTPRLASDVMSLPIASDVMKLVILPHTLDFCQDPYQTLREADRVLTNDGHIIIVGFSPWSLFGARKALLRWNRQVPWNGKFYSRNRVSDWLSVLSYRVHQSQSFFLRPPLGNEKVLRRLNLLEKNQRWLGMLGAVYLIHAKKQTIPVTPAKRLWLPQRGMIKSGSLASVRESGVASASSSAKISSIHKNASHDNSNGLNKK